MAKTAKNVRLVAPQGECLPKKLKEQHIQPSGISWHWLMGRDGNGPTLAKLHMNMWQFINGEIFSPEAAYNLGWRWLKQVKLPKKTPASE